MDGLLDGLIKEAQTGYRHRSLVGKEKEKVMAYFKNCIKPNLTNN
jgi:hypothetical protein